MLTPELNYRMCAQFLAAITALGGTLASAQSVSTEFFSVTLPTGWAVKSEPDGNVTATPSSDVQLPNIAVDSCNRSSKTNCPQSCETNTLRSHFFYFFADEPTAVYEERRREDGFKDIRASGSVGSPPTWVAGSVLCGPKGIVYIVSMSTLSRNDAGRLVEATVGSLRWSSAVAVSSKMPNPTFQRTATWPLN